MVFLTKNHENRDNFRKAPSEGGGGCLSRNFSGQTLGLCSGPPSGLHTSSVVHAFRSLACFIFMLSGKSRRLKLFRCDLFANLLHMNYKNDWATYLGDMGRNTSVRALLIFYFIQFCPPNGPRSYGVHSSMNEVTILKEEIPRVRVVCHIFKVFLVQC